MGNRFKRGSGMVYLAVFFALFIGFFVAYVLKPAEGAGKSASFQDTVGLGEISPACGSSSVCSVANAGAAIACPTCNFGTPSVKFEWKETGSSNRMQCQRARITGAPTSNPAAIFDIATDVPCAGDYSSDTYTWNGAQSNTSYFYWINYKSAGPRVFRDNFNGFCTNQGQWSNISGRTSPNCTISSGTFTVGIGGTKGLYFEGPGDAKEAFLFSDYGDGTFDGVSIKGFNFVYVQYSRATEGLSGADQFVVQYSLDGGAFQTLETVTGTNPYSNASNMNFMVPNPGGAASVLTLRFLLNADSITDKAAIDSLIVSNALPLTLFSSIFDRGFTCPNNYFWYDYAAAPSCAVFSGTFTVGVGGTQGMLLEGGTGINPDDGAVTIDADDNAVIKIFGYSKIRVQYSRATEGLSDLALGDKFVTEYSFDGVTFQTLETVTGTNPHTPVSFDIDNPGGLKQYLVLRFHVDGNDAADKAGVDDVLVTAVEYVDSFHEIDQGEFSTANCAAFANKPVAVADVSLNASGPFANSVTVTQNTPVTIYFSGAGSSDPDGWTSASGVSTSGICQWNSNLDTLASDTWFSRTDATNPAPLLSPSDCVTSYNHNFSNPVGGYTYDALRITDNWGATSTIAQIQVNVSSFLTAYAGADKIIPVSVVGTPSTVGFMDATASGGTPPLSYNWSCTGAGALNNNTLLNPVYTAPMTSEVAVCALTVTDSASASASDAMYVNVVAVAIDVNLRSQVPDRQNWDVVGDKIAGNNIQFAGVVYNVRNNYSSPSVARICVDSGSEDNCYGPGIGSLGDFAIGSLNSTVDSGYSANLLSVPWPLPTGTVEHTYYVCADVTNTNNECASGNLPCAQDSAADNCVSATFRAFQCGNGVDDADPEDTLADCADPGCHSDADASNPATCTVVEQTNDDNEGGWKCSDNSDNDCDGFCDWNGCTPTSGCNIGVALPGEGACIGPTGDDETTQCQDTFDNDDDGIAKIDTTDPGCHTDGNPNNPATYDPNDNDERDETFREIFLPLTKIFAMLFGF